MTMQVKISVQPLQDSDNPRYYDSYPDQAPCVTVSDSDEYRDAVQITLSNPDRTLVFSRSDLRQMLHTLEAASEG